MYTTWYVFPYKFVFAYDGLQGFQERHSFQVL